MLPDVERKANFNLRKTSNHSRSVKQFMSLMDINEIIIYENAVTQVLQEANLTVMKKEYSCINTFACCL